MAPELRFCGSIKTPRQLYGCRGVFASSATLRPSPHRDLPFRRHRVGVAGVLGVRGPLHQVRHGRCLRRRSVERRDTGARSRDRQDRAMPRSAARPPRPASSSAVWWPPRQAFGPAPDRQLRERRSSVARSPEYSCGRPRPYKACQSRPGWRSMLGGGCCKETFSGLGGCMTAFFSGLGPELPGFKREEAAPWAVTFSPSPRFVTRAGRAPLSGSSAARHFARPVSSPFWGARSPGPVLFR